MATRGGVSPLLCLQLVGLVLTLSLIAFVAHQTSRVDVLLVGDVTTDVVPDGKAAGGSITYAAAVLSSLGIRACVVTAAGSDADLSVFQPHELHVVPSTATLTFEHTYTWWGHSRKLRVTADPNITLSRHHVPSRCQRARLVVLGPLTLNDVDAQSFLTYDSVLDRLLRGPWQRIAYMAQGTQRQLGAKGAVLPLSSPSQRLLDGLGPRVSVFLSDVETEPWSAFDVARVAAAAERLIVTRGDKGAEEYNTSGVFQVAAVPVETVKDTNGAGDTFATMYALSQAWGVADPAYVAAFAASRAVQQPQSCKPGCVGNSWAHLAQAWPLSLKIWMDLKALGPHLLDVALYALQPYEPWLSCTWDTACTYVSGTVRKLSPSFYATPLQAHITSHSHSIPPPGTAPRPGQPHTQPHGAGRSTGEQAETDVSVSKLGQKRAHPQGVGAQLAGDGSSCASLVRGGVACDHVGSTAVVQYGEPQPAEVCEVGKCPAGGQAGRHRGFKRWVCSVLDSMKYFWDKSASFPELPGASATPDQATSNAQK